MTTLRTTIAALAFAALTLPALVRAGEPAPELKKTVDAFAGRWSVDATLAVGPAAPAKLKVTIDCKKTAAGRAVACQMRGATPMGPMEASLLIGYDEYSKAVHVMAMTSDGEVHDHVCHWKDDALGCDRLKGGMGTQAITEDLGFRLDGKKLAFESVVTMPDGAKMTFAGTSSRK